MFSGTETLQEGKNGRILKHVEVSLAFNKRMGLFYIINKHNFMNKSPDKLINN
jgi:hypothetical protein